jgi:hypothetical protein
MFKYTQGDLFRDVEESGFFEEPRKKSEIGSSDSIKVKSEFLIDTHAFIDRLDEFDVREHVDEMALSEGGWDFDDDLWFQLQEKVRKRWPGRYARISELIEFIRNTIIELYGDNVLVEGALDTSFCDAIQDDMSKSWKKHLRRIHEQWEKMDKDIDLLRERFDAHKRKWEDDVNALNNAEGPERKKQKVEA